jgi:hypothetical protein
MNSKSLAVDLSPHTPGLVQRIDHSMLPLVLSKEGGGVPVQQHHALEAYSFSGRTIRRFLSRDRLACMMLPSHFGACAKDETGGRRSPCWFLFTSDGVGSFFSVAKHWPWDYVGDLVENEKEDREQIFVC